jgi:hypothetical protein
MNPYRVSSFEEFWPHYLRMHSRPWTQRLHALATLSAAALLSCAIALRAPLLALAAPLVDYAIAQLAHRLFERNATRPWRHPPWHLRAELRLCRLVLTGQLPRR